MNFALIGAGGYIAPRHLQAILETGNHLVCALDPSDSVGILDRYFDEVEFFTDFERLDRFVGLLRRKEKKRAIEYVSICSPNYLHDAHIRFALCNEADAICEKPLVLNPWNLDALEDDEQETGHRVFNVLQLRVHPTILALKEQIENDTTGKRHFIDLSYITRRGNWYHYSWKGDLHKSGGIATNIGIHFFDMLLWIFGKVVRHEVHVSDYSKAAGFLELEKADVRWFLSVDKQDLPESILKTGVTTFRSITLDGDEIEFSNGFTDLHTVVYQQIFNGNGYGINESRLSIELAHEMRQTKVKVKSWQNVHPMVIRLVHVK